MNRNWAGRQTPEVRERLREGTVAVAGLGGLGSNIALMLARTGISKLFLADFDRVDPSNLNRQAYTISQIGMKKTEAMSELIRQVNPWIELEFFDGRVTQENAAELFRTYPIICEAFDSRRRKRTWSTVYCLSCLAIPLFPAAGWPGLTARIR